MSTDRQLVEAILDAARNGQVISFRMMNNSDLSVRVSENRPRNATSNRSISDHIRHAWDRESEGLDTMLQMRIDEISKQLSEKFP
jgi:hypothetical protein